MIRAFGEENQQSDFDWEAEYGKGFDVLNFVTPSPRLYESGADVADLRVKLYLAKVGVAWRLGGPKSSQVPEHAPDLGLYKVKQQPKFVDIDPEETEVDGDLPILFYLSRFYDNEDHDASTRAASARVISRVGRAERLLDLWRQIRDVPAERRTQGPDGSGTQLLTTELKLWESHLEDGQYIAGETFSMADCAFWPILKEIMQKWKSWGAVKCPRLTRYHELILQRAMDAKIL